MYSIDNTWILLATTLFVVAGTVAYFVCLSGSFSKRKKDIMEKINPRMQQLSFDDAYLDERLRPLYRSISHNVNTSVRWLHDIKAKATDKFKRAPKGDGLSSIYSAIPPKHQQGSQHFKLSKVRSGVLERHKDLAFQALFDWGIFAGTEMSLLKDICKHTTILSKEAGDVIFSPRDLASDCLYILHTGKCSASFALDDSSPLPIHEMQAGTVLASLPDVIAWIVSAEVKREVTVTCLEKCEILMIPSPKRLENFESHATSFARIVRMLLIRLNRTTVATAFFYLGLAKHFLPTFDAITVPPELVELCESGSIYDADITRINSFVHSITSSLYGVPMKDICSNTVEDVLSLDTPSDDAVAPPVFGKRSRSFDSMAPVPTVTQPLSLQELSIPSTETVVTENKQLKKRTGLCKLSAGESLLTVDEVPGLYIVVSGRLRVSFVGNITQQSSLHPHNRHRDESKVIFSSGAALGQIALIAGTSEEWYGRQDGSSAPMLSVIADCDSWLLKIPIAYYARVLGERPDVMFHLGCRVVCGLPPLIRVFDFCTRYMKLDGGDDLVVKGQKSAGCLYAVLSGRLRMMSGDDMEDIDERSLSRGDLIGDSQLLTGEPFHYTVRAIRQTAVTCIPVSFLDYLSQEYPSILINIARNVSKKHSPMERHKYSSAAQAPMSKSLMLVPVSGSVPLDLVASVLKATLKNYVNGVKLITSSYASSVFGCNLNDFSDDDLLLTVGTWLNQIELDSEIVLYQADWGATNWNRLCASQSDEILLLANAMDNVESTMTELDLLGDSKLIPKTLVLIYVNPSTDLKPINTRKWIESRKGVHRHVQVRLHTNNLHYDGLHVRSDFNRLARILTNCAVGLVLGGGGARGLTHIGIIKALEENGVPVDYIGGTSIGSFVGALVAAEERHAKIKPMVATWSKTLSHWWFYVQDLTLPITSYFNGYNFTAALKKCVKRQKIEDFWLNYYCITTDLTNNSERVHVNGTAWRYIRASMSLVNLLPPLCDVDPSDGSCHYLIDGGYVNIVPIDVMRQRMGAGVVIAVDVSGGWSMEATHNYGDILNGLSVLLSQLNPFAKRQKVPSMAEISTQLAYVAACRHINKIKSMADLYIQPPVEEYSVLDFGKFDELHDLGLCVGREQVKKWIASLWDDGSSCLRRYRWLRGNKTEY